MCTISSSPTGDDTGGTVSNVSAGNTDGPHEVVEHQWIWQAYYGYVTTLARAATRVEVMQCHRNAGNCLSSRFR